MNEWFVVFHNGTQWVRRDVRTFEAACRLANQKTAASIYRLRGTQDELCCGFPNG